MANLKVSLENIIPLTEARDHFSQIVSEVQKDKLYVLTKGGKPAVAIIDVKYLESVTGGIVRTEHIESEIQKDPTKVGRTPMVKHEGPASLVFPKSDADQPLKVNFQPEAKPAPLTSPAPLTPPPVVSTPAPLPPTPSPAPLSPPPMPAPPQPPAPAGANPLGGATPLATTPPTIPPLTPSAPTNIPISVKSNPPSTAPGSTIDVTPTPEEMNLPTTPSVSPDDKAGPAQYAGDTGEPEDMEI